MTVVLRNTDTGQITQLDGDSNSEEYQTLVRQRRARDGRPLWEETGQHDRLALLDRLAHGALRPEDIGDVGQPFNTILGEPAPITSTPSGMIDRMQPTATERASNAGRAALSAGEEFVPTILNDEGTIASPTDDTGIKPHDMPEPEMETPPLESKTDMDSVNAEHTADADEMEDDTADEAEPTVAADHPDVVTLVADNTHEDLKAEAEARDLPKSGSKEDLARAIVEHDSATDAPAASPPEGSGS